MTSSSEIENSSQPAGLKPKCVQNHLKLAPFIRSPRLYPLAKGSDRISEIAASNRAQPLTFTWTQVRGYFRPCKLLMQRFNHCQPGILMIDGHNSQNNQDFYITQSKKLFHNSFEITAHTVNKCMQLLCAVPLQCNEHRGVWNHQHIDCLLIRLFSAHQRKYYSSASLAFVRETTGDRWIPLTKGQ